MAKPPFLKEGSMREEARDKRASKRLGVSERAYEKTGRDKAIDKGKRPPPFAKKGKK